MSDDALRAPHPDDEPVTAADEAAAEALRQALDEGAPAGPVRRELEAAALLGFSRDAGALPADRAAAVLRRVVAEAPPEAPALDRARRRHGRWRWAAPAVAGAAAAAALLVVTLRGPGPALPRPPAGLLRAQLGAARGEPAAAARLEREMRTYRDGMYAALGDRYRGRR